MREQLLRWIEARTGLRTVARVFFGRPIPGGPRWRYVFAPALAATFLIQLVTGLLLMSSYSPSASQAWGSVWFIQYEMVLGWLIRGLHHFGSSAMVVLVALFLIQEVVTRAYRAPREVSWWLGLILIQLILGLALTGYLLPWDQKGYWATKVATNIMGSTPVIGPYLLDVVVGGSEYGNQTLTRLFSLHVAVLPWLILMVLTLRLLLYYRHGIAAPEGAPAGEPTWPGQIYRNLTAVAIVLMVLLGVVYANGGANLEAPADPSVSDYPARPEWYFLFLFQMLNYFESPYEVVGTHVIPGVLFLFLFLLPLLDQVLPKRLVYFSACGLLLVVIGGVAALMTEAILADRTNVTFQLARRDADTQRERSLQLAGVEGVPPDGAVYMLRRDPWTHGRAILEQKCLSCHYYDGRGSIARQVIEVSAQDLAEAATTGKFEGLPELPARALEAKIPDFTPLGAIRLDAAGGILGGYRVVGTNGAGERLTLIVTPEGRTIQQEVMSQQTAADLAGFGGRDWIRGLLDDPSSPRFFGTMPKLDGMKTWKAGSRLNPEQLDDVADFVAELGSVENGESFFDWYERRYLGNLESHPGHDLFVEDCGQCHLVGSPDFSITEGGFMEAPNLFAYGSSDWLTRMIHEPASEDLYGYLPEESQMPGFEGRLSENDVTTLVRYLGGDYLPPNAADSASLAQD